MATASDKNYGWNYGRVVALDKNADLALAEGLAEAYEGEDIACGCATCEYDRENPEVLGTDKGLSNNPQ